MEITFLDVGQGDSIFLEWMSENNTTKYGIIDANIKDNQNPTLDFLISKKVTELEFIILSHPHSDHYSGLLDILLHAKNNNIKIKYFLHTCPTVYQNLILSSFRSISDMDLFSEIMSLANTLEEQGLLSELSFVNNLTRPIKISNKFHFEFYFPDNKSYKKFNASSYKEKDGIALKNNPNFNYLSTIIKIYSDHEFVLLTSDADISVFENLFERFKESKSNLIFCQIPHHGSKNNFNSEFWLKCNRKLSCNNAIVSFGFNNKHKHPSQYVINTLKRYGYKIYSTNQRKNIDSDVVSEIDVLDLISTRINTSTNVFGKNVSFKMEETEDRFDGILL